MSKRETRRMSREEKEHLVSVPVRIMGTPHINNLFFVAKDVCILIHTRKGNVAKGTPALACSSWSSPFDLTVRASSAHLISSCRCVRHSWCGLTVHCCLPPPALLSASPLSAIGSCNGVHYCGCAQRQPSVAVPHVVCGAVLCCACGVVRVSVSSRRRRRLECRCCACEATGRCRRTS